ncbi:hypothetical protein BY458DRAFT_560514 [Sporodiniella umbellata]|nr:hypothetical protein BY458DRAFT_560514 [Sporodiniella umbellata]
MSKVNIKPSKDSWAIISKLIEKSNQPTSKLNSKQSNIDTNYLLSAEEKIKFKATYDSLDISKMWVLQNMESPFYGKRDGWDYEYPQRTLTLIPKDIGSHLGSFYTEFADALDLYYKTYKSVFHPFDEKGKKRIQQTYASIADP